MGRDVRRRGQRLADEDARREDARTEPAHDKEDLVVQRAHIPTVDCDDRAAGDEAIPAHADTRRAAVVLGEVVRPVGVKVLKNDVGR